MAKALKFKHSAFVSDFSDNLLERTIRRRLRMAKASSTTGCSSACGSQALIGRSSHSMQIMPMDWVTELEQPHLLSGHLVGAEIARDKISGYAVSLRGSAAGRRTALLQGGL